MIVYKVMNYEEWVGTFCWAIFSTEEKANEYVARESETHCFEAGDLYVDPYELDSD